MHIDPRRRRDAWGRSSVREILVNPKYTGYMVWNRRGTKKGGAINHPDVWVWSAEPVHPPLVSQADFLAAAAVGVERFGSRSGNGANSAHPQTRRSYLLRGMVVCALCGRRMVGKSRAARGRPDALLYYVCEAPRNHADFTERYPEHPRGILLAERRLLAGINDFLNTRLLGPDRLALLTAEIDHAAVVEQDDRVARRAALQRTLADIATRQRRLLTTLETQDDLTGAVFSHVQQRIAELDVQRRAAQEALDELDAQDATVAAATPDLGLLGRVPLGRLDVADLPQATARRLLDALRLRIRYDRAANQAQAQITLDVETADALDSTIIRTDVPSEDRLHGGSAFSLPRCAPGGIRTHTVGGLSTVSLPLEYRGRQPRFADAGS